MSLLRRGASAGDPEPLASASAPLNPNSTTATTLTYDQAMARVHTDDRGMPRSALMPLNWRWRVGPGDARRLLRPAIGRTLSPRKVIGAQRPKGLSSHTVASYSDTFRLPVSVRHEANRSRAVEAANRRFRRVVDREIPTAPRTRRGNSVRTRNTALAAVHAFFRFVAVSEPALFLQCQRILAIPSKRCEHGPVEFLTESEAAALVGAPDVRTWI